MSDNLLNGPEGGGNRINGDPPDQTPHERERRECDDGYKDVPYHPTWRQQFPSLFLSRPKTASLMSFIFDLESLDDGPDYYTPKDIAAMYTDAKGEAIEPNIVNNVFNYFQHDEVDYLLEHVVAAVADRGRFPLWHDRMLKAHEEDASRPMPHYATPVNRANGDDEPLPSTGDDAEDIRLATLAEATKQAAKRGGNRGRIIGRHIRTGLGGIAGSTGKKVETIRITEAKYEELRKLTQAKD